MDATLSPIDSADVILGSNHGGGSFEKPQSLVIRNSPTVGFLLLDLGRVDIVERPKSKA
jgi:hypothetical protein